MGDFPFSNKMRRLLIVLAFLAYASADPSIPNTGQYQNNYNQVDEPAAREAQNGFADIDSYNSPLADPISTNTYDVKINDPASGGQFVESAGPWVTYPGGNEGVTQFIKTEDYIYSPVQKLPNNALGLSDWIYNGLLLFLAFLAIGQSFQLAKNIWALKLGVWDNWVSARGGRNLDPATMEMIKNSIDQAALKFADWIQEE